MGYTTQSTDDEQSNESEGKHHRCRELDGPSPQRKYPVENLHAGWYRNQHGGDCEDRVRHWAKAHGEHVVAPYRPTHDSDDYPREDDERVAEQGFPGERR